MNALELHSGEYVERFKKSPIKRLQRLVHLMEIEPTDAIADYGCGTGMLLSLLPKIASYDGVDFSPDFIAAAESMAEGMNVREAQFHCRDIREFCAENRGRFDIATTMDFSEHVEDDDFIEIYTAIRDSLKRGGTLYLHTPNGDFFVERLKEIGILKQFPEHVAVRTAARNVEILRCCGFDNVRCRILPHYNVLRLLHPMSKLPAVGRIFGARLLLIATN